MFAKVFEAAVKHALGIFTGGDFGPGAIAKAAEKVQRAAARAAKAAAKAK